MASGLQRNIGAAIPNTPSSIAAAVDAAAETFATRAALTDRRASYSFVELRNAVDRASGAFRAAGLHAGDRVAVSLPNSVDVVVSFLAAMRSGLIWVGVNTHLAGPEKQYLVADSGARALLFDPNASGPIPVDANAAVHHIVADVNSSGSWWSEHDPAPFVASSIDQFAPAAIAYTSGTTGRPKGAVHSQHNMLLPGAVITAGDPGPLSQGVCLPLTIVNMQVLATVQCLLSGSNCIPMDRIDVRGVADWIRDFQIQRMYTTPPTVYDLLTRPDIDASELSSLRQLAVGGTKAPAGLAERYRERFGRDFTFGYGLTEAPTSVTGPIGFDSPAAPAGSSGWSRPQVEVTIRDANDAVVPSGTEGEICVSGATSGPYAGCYTTMLGYWNQPDATATTLRNGILHTGDVGVIDADGLLWVRDRKSDLIIRGGANVYPAEVERVVESTGLVAEVAVVSRDHPRLGEEVVAFVAPSGATLDVAALDRECRAQLAAYKVPVTWYEVTSFPRNAMGKVVKTELRKILAACPSDSTPPAAIRHDPSRNDTGGDRR